jgi:hypothetical protein
MYEREMTQAERADLEEARDMEGLGEEIAALRVRLAKLYRDEGLDPKVLLRASEVLMRAVATQYRLSPKAKRDLAENVAALLNSIGDQVLPVDR